MRSTRVGIAATLVAAILGAGCTSNIEEPSATSAHAIQDGVVADGEAPYVGSFLIDGSFCTGTLIGRSTVLTAAHCVGFGSSPPSATRHGSFCTGPGSCRSVAGYWSMSPLPGALDLAVLHLEAPFPETMPLANVASSYRLDASVSVTTYGFGSWGPQCANDPDDHKRKVTTSYGSPIPARVCPGDSGGPVIVTGTHDIIGVNSVGVRPFVPIAASWPADPQNHYEWIEARLRESERGTAPPSPSGYTACMQWQTFRGWSCVNASGFEGGSSHIIRCDGAQALELRACPSQCYAHGVGDSDHCVPNVSRDNLCSRHPTWRTWNCATSAGLAGGAGATHRVRCWDGMVLARETCTNGCAVGPEGQDDTCR